MNEDEQGDGEPEVEVVPLPSSPLRWVADSYYRTQRERIRCGNQISAVERGADQMPIPVSIMLHQQRMLLSEDELIRDMERLTVAHPAMHWLGQVRGVGPVLAAKTIGLIEKIDTFDTCSKLWRFAGYAVMEAKCRTCMGTGMWTPARAKADVEPVVCPACNGSLLLPQRERPVKGERLHYNVRLKTVVYLVATSFLKGGSPYRVVYDQARAHYEVRRPYWTKAHQHMAAMRKMSKLFLSHLWQTWREAEGLSTRPPYALEYLEHSTFSDPWTFTDAKKTAKQAKAKAEREGRAPVV